MIGADGVEEIIEMGLKPPQKEMFAKSVASVQEMIDKLHKANFFEQ
jgi:malate dehydrogenase